MEPVGILESTKISILSIWILIRFNKCIMLSGLPSQSQVYITKIVYMFLVEDLQVEMDQFV